ncbi:hypothetical protein CPB84DRAFT_1765145 [Gymnopilus junonius]|uniref:F-box domain-containing protein n=1 Tax=Gymnopilus junonius TaxID=109634 RepID=A0A9P5NYZ3_GYMJU|nr:hypothetical protein CPB84DRAFT_1765145 [Gymnopilus junonius]
MADVDASVCQTEDSQMDPSCLGVPPGFTDLSSFPFSYLDSTGVRTLYGIPPSEFDINYHSPIARGNYLTTSIQVGLRKQFCGRNRAVNVNLGALFDLPPDIILEAFSYLHPLDLYNLMQVTKAIRNILLDRNLSASVWKNAFRRNPIIWHYPPDVPPPKWVSLLFGPATCDFCPSKNAMPDFTYRRRLCKECLDRMCFPKEIIKENVVLLDMYPNEEETLFRLVRCTYRPDGMTYPSQKHYLEQPRYWIEDVHAKAEEMTPFLKALDAGIPGAAENYDAFKAKAFRENLQHIKHARSCHLWCLGVYQSYEGGTFSMRKTTFISRASKHIIRLGYKRDEIPGNVYNHCLEYFRNVKHIRFSKKDLHKYLPELENHVLKYREDRLKCERIRNRRRASRVIAPTSLSHTVNHIHQSG